MNKQIRNRTWKYFWEQKRKEIGLTFVITTGAIFIPYWVGLLCLEIFNEIEHEKGLIWIYGIAGLFVLGLVVLVVWCWIDTNWEKAERRAKKDFKRKKK